MSVHVLLFMLRTCAQGADSRQWVLSGRDVSRRPQHEHQTKVVVANGVGVSVDTGAYYCYSSLRWRSHSAPALWRRRESAWVLRYQGVENDVIFVLRGPRRDSGSSPFIGFLSFSPFLYQHCLSVLSNSAYVSQLFHSLVVRFFHCIQIHFHSLKFKSLHVFFLLVFFSMTFPDHHNSVYLKPSHVHFPLFLVFPLRFLPSFLTPGPRRSPLCIFHFGSVKDFWPVRCSDSHWSPTLVLFISSDSLLFPCQPGTSIQCNVLCLSIPVALFFFRTISQLVL